MRYRAVEARSRDAVWWTAALHSGGCLGGLAWTRRGGRTTSRAPRAPPRAGRRNARPTARSARPRSSSRSRSWRRRGRGLPCSLRRPWARRPSRGPSSRPSARPATGAYLRLLGAPGHARAAQGDAAARLRAAASPFARWPPPTPRDADAARPGDVSLDGAAGDDASGAGAGGRRPRAPRARAPARAPGARRPRRARVPVARGRRPARIVSLHDAHYSSSKQ